MFRKKLRYFKDLIIHLVKYHSKNKSTLLKFLCLCLRVTNDLGLIILKYASILMLIVIGFTDSEAENRMVWYSIEIEQW